MAGPDGVTSSPIRDLGGVGTEPEAIDGSTSLARATKTQTTAKSEVPSDVVAMDEAKPRELRAREAKERVVDAVETAEKALSGWVSEEDADVALRALAGLRPEELGIALKYLEEDGRLDDLVRNLSPERMLDLTRMLASSSIFPWAQAVDEGGNAIEGAPRLVVQHEKLPPSLQALAHDINLAIAKQHPDMKLNEPGAHGGFLDTKQGTQFGWRDIGFGAQTRHVEAFVNRYLAATDIDSSVHQLRPGDSYKLSADAGVKVGVGARGASASVGPALSAGVEVSRADDGKSFTVSADSTLLGKLSAAAGISEMAKLKAEVGAGGGGKVEFTFKTADEAARAAQLMLEATTNPLRFAADAALHPGDVGKVLGALSAVELGPQAASKLGLDVEAGHSLLGAEKGRSAELAGSLSTTYRVEFEKGEPVALSAKTSMAFESSVGESQAFKSGDFSADFSKGIGASVHVDIEHRVEIRPGASLKDVAHAALNAPATMTIGLEAKKSGGFGESGAELEFKLEGKSDMLVATAIALQQGDVLTAANAIDKAEVTTKSTSASGMALSMGLEAGGDGASIGMKAMRKRQLHKRTEEGTGREMALRLLKSLGGQVGPDAPRPVEVRSVRPE